jgi:RNA polymerase-binding protein DksA
MDKKTLKEFKERLEAEKASLLKQLEQIQRKPIGSQEVSKADFPDYGDKEDENAAEVATFADNISIESDLRNNLKNVEHALQHIQEGKFGICEKCGKEINVERLKIFPSATLCISCGKKT